MTIEPFERDMFNDFDINDHEFNDRFYDVLDSFIGECPVAKSKVGDGYYVLNRFRDVKRAAQDWETFSSANGFIPNRDPEMPLLPPTEMDPPDHSSWRRALQPFFSREATKTYEEPIRKDAIELIDSFVDKGECDIVADFTSILPGRAMFSNLFDIPYDDIPMLAAQMDAGFYGPVETRAERFNEGVKYINDYLEQRFRQPSTGALVDVVAAGVEVDGKLCSWQDRLGVLTDILVGGVVTAASVMAGGFWHLATHPEDREALANDFSKIPTAAEEFIRYFPPVVMLGREVMRDVEIGGNSFKKGDYVLLNYASASRDPEAVPDPQKCDIYRRGVPSSSFGIGIHRCMGAHLARLEIKIAFEEFLRRIPDFEMSPGAQPVYETGNLRSMTSLKLRFPTRLTR
jgi:cytochrome P450